MAEAKWVDENYLKAYQLARSSLPRMKIAKALGVSWPTFKKWMKTKPALRNAILSAKRELSEAGRDTYQDFVYRRLPKKLRPLWKKIHFAHKKNKSVEYVEELLRGSGTRTRQMLFLHAFVKYNFNKTEACRALNMSVKTLESWIRREPGFFDIMTEIKEGQKDFFEGAVVQLVKNLDPGTVRMVAESFLSDRGYGKKVKVEQTGEISHSHKLLPVDELGLDASDMRKLLDKIRERNQQAIEDKSEVQDAEFTVR